MLVPAVIVALAVACAAAPDPARTLKTAAGELRVGASDAAGQCPVALAGKTLKAFDCRTSYPPRILGHFKAGFGRFQEVVVLQEQPMGNACNGGPLHVLAIRAGAGELAGPVDFCGGSDPVLEQDGTSLIVKFPGGSPNRGEVSVLDEVWRWDDGRVTRVK
jgi:hypothetical protein